MEFSAEDRHRLLVIDDNEAIHDDMRKILAPVRAEAGLEADEALLFDAPATVEIGFEVDAAYQGQEGLERLRQARADGRPYAVAFVDVRMPPGWDGVETAGHLWGEDPDLQIVMCTAYSDYSWRDIHRRLGRSHNLVILKKPFDNIEVVQLAHAMTAKRGAMQQARLRMEALDQKVRERTEELQQAHDRLRRELDQRLEAETAFAAVFAQSPMAVALCDWEWRHLDVNGEFLRALGLAREEVIGKTHGQLGLQVSIRSAEVLRERRIQGGPINALEVEFVHPSMGESTALIWMREVRIFGQPRRLLFLLDITERKRMEEDLRRAREQAESASRAKSEFLSHMSHEIRTPLNGLLGLAALLEEKQLPGEARFHVQAIHSAGEMLQRVLNDVLDFSKIDAGRLELERLPFEIRSCCEQTVALFRSAAEQKGLQLKLRLEEGLPRQLMGDISRLQQVLMNLLGNAIKFTERGAVELRAEYEARREEPGRLRLSVCDTGIGIPAGRIDRLFRPFSQVDSSTSRRFGGTGLGLIISKRIVERMGGTIGVESIEGQGSTFRIEIPAEVVLAEPASRQEAAPVLREGLRVLVAEDNRINQLVTVHLLEKIGAVVDLAPDGEEAVRLATSRTYDLVLMDVQMPGTDGLEAARRIRERMGEGLPILALTAHACKEDAARCRQAGMDDYLTKPITAVTLGKALARWAPPEGEGARLKPRAG